MTKPLAALGVLFLAACAAAPAPVPSPMPVPLATATPGPISQALSQTPRPDPSEPPTDHADIAGTVVRAGTGGFTVDSPGHEWDDIAVGVDERTVIWVPDGDVGYRRGSIGDIEDGRLVRVWLGPLVLSTAPPRGDGFEIVLLRPGTNGALPANVGGLISNASPTPMK